MFIDQSAENLKQEEFQNEVTRIEEDRVKTATQVEQDRVTTFTRMEADRVTTFAMEDTDRHLARRKRQLRQQLEMLKLRQQYLAGTITDLSNIPEHMGTHARDEQKITSRNTQDQFSTAGRLGGGLFIHQDLGGPFPIKITAQRTPEVTLQKGDVSVEYNHH